MSNLIPRSSGSLVKSDGVVDKVSDGLIVAGLGVVPVWVTAMLLPGGVFIWATLYVIAGVVLGGINANKNNDY